MKQIYNRQSWNSTRFIYHEEPDPHVDSIEETIRARTEATELSDEEIHELAHRFAELVTSNEAFALAFEEAIGELEAHELDTWVQTLETHIIQTSAEGRAVERAVTNPVLGEEPSGVAIPLSEDEFNEIYDGLETSVDIPDDMRADIQSYVIHNLETSANPDDDDNTERLDEEEINRLAEAMITNHAIFLKTAEFGETTIDGTPIGEAQEADPEAERISDVARRISEEFDHVSPEMLMRAMAGNHEGFGVNEDGESTPITEDNIRELAESLNETGEEVDTQIREELEAEGLTPDTPEYEAEYNRRYNERMNDAVERMRLEDVETLGDLIRLLLQYMYPEQFEEEGGPFDENGRPLATSTPRGNTRAAENAPNHISEIRLNPEFYGEELINDFTALTESNPEVLTSFNTITEDPAWGGDESGWKLAVMRHAVTQNGLDASKPFFANDLGTYRAIIYIPNRSGGPILTTCVGGSGRNGGGGISNVANSYGSPLGSFEFRPSDVAYLPNHRYRARATVHGLEPMRENFRVQRGEGGNIDPSAGNTNSAGRAILMHGVNPGAGSTWGCWGVDQQVAVEFAQAIEQFGGAAGEAFVSVA